MQKYNLASKVCLIFKWVNLVSPTFPIYEFMTNNFFTINLDCVFIKTNYTENSLKKFQFL